MLRDDTAGGRTRVSQITAGGGYLGQRDPRRLFGLGDLDSIEKLVVRWPDGQQTTYRNLAIDRYHEFTQPDP